jgi:PncC family amidohydrolase
MFIVPDTQANLIRQSLLDKNETIAVAESVTAGLLQHALSTIPDASRFWQGGITAYNVAQKFKHLRVEPLHALAVNCVSEQVAQQMALHACDLFSSQWGVGITGYATPQPEWGNELIAYFAIAHDGRIVCSEKINIPEDAEPTSVQQEYTEKVIRELVRHLSCM